MRASFPRATVVSGGEPRRDCVSCSHRRLEVLRRFCFSLSGASTPRSFKGSVGRWRLVRTGMLALFVLLIAMLLVDCGCVHSHVWSFGVRQIICSRRLLAAGLLDLVRGASRGKILFSGPLVRREFSSLKVLRAPLEPHRFRTPQMRYWFGDNRVISDTTYTSILFPLALSGAGTDRCRCRRCNTD